MSYFLFYNSGEDEQWEIYGPWTGPQVLKDLRRFKGEGIDFELHAKFPDLSFSSKSARVVVVKGEVVVPKAIKVVERYELP